MIDPDYPAPQFSWPMSAAVFEMAGRAAVTSAEAQAHVQNEYDV